MKKYSFVLVKWLDSNTLGMGWMPFEVAMKCAPATCSSVGFLIRNAKDSVSLAQNIGTDQALNIVSIPKCSILEIVGLTVDSGAKTGKGEANKPVAKRDINIG